VAEQVRGLSSMATKALLADLCDALWRRRTLSVQFESAGGIEVARSIRAGAKADLAVLSEEEMSDLAADALFEPGTLQPLFVSDVVAAVPEDLAAVPLATEKDLRAALVGAGRIAYSTGPSGKALRDLIERWDLVGVVEHKLVQARPGTPVASLLAEGGADLGFQQRSELSDLARIRVLGPLPGAAAIRSTFSGAVLARSTNSDSAREVLSFFGSKDAEEHVLAAGMMIATVRPSPHAARCSRPAGS
jgi:molybdate transport system substrate-binding protein